MSHCHDEHSHSHSHGDDNHSHDHSDDITPALQSYIYQQIEFDKIVTLNESEPGSGAAVVKKGWEKRLDPHPEVVSDADEQLLMYIPYVNTILYCFRVLVL